MATKYDHHNEPSNVVPLHPKGVNLDLHPSRPQADHDLAVANGFAPTQRFFHLGQDVQTANNAAVGRLVQIQHEAKPYAANVCRMLAARVQDEHRLDLPGLTMGELKMTEGGRLELPVRNRIPISEHAFAGLMSRYPCPSGIAYLKACNPKLRAINFNHWSRTAATTDVKLRTRQVDNEQTVYAAVSSSYTACDLDVVAGTLERAFVDTAVAGEARGSANYDGYRYRIEGLWHTNVDPGEYLSGECFRVGVIVRGDDSGSGSIHIQSVIHRAACLNMLILDKSIGVDIRIRHVGDVRKIFRRVRDAFNKAQGSITPFLEKWREASRTNVGAPLADTFRGILENELVKVPGRATNIIPHLVQMHGEDELLGGHDSTRASIINAFTRYAHKVETNPFSADAIREGAGRLLTRSGSLPCRAA